MLKTLEEPPEYLKFVLATTDPQKVPVTVLSRCLQFNLRPMAPETVLEHLTRVLETEAVPAETQALRLLARAARGSMRDALSLTDQAIAFSNGEIREAGVRQMLGSVDRGHVFRLIEALAQGDGKTVVETAEGLRRDGLSAASTLEEMTTVLQGMAVAQAVPSRAQADAGGDPDAIETARLAALMPADETHLLYSLCLHGRGELGLAPDEYAALTMVLLRLLAFKPGGAATGEKKTLNEAPRREMPPAPVASAGISARPAAAPPAAQASGPSGPSGPPGPSMRSGYRLPVVEAPPALNASASPRPMAVRPTQPVEAQVAAQVVAMPVRVQPPSGAREGEATVSLASIKIQPGEPSEEGDFWCDIVARMVAAESITALTRELALQSQLVARDVDQWLLRVERESLNQPGSRDKLRGALAALGHDVKIAIEIGAVTDSPARRNKQAADERQRIAEEAIRNDPEVQSMMRDWDARIVPGSLRPV
jgi:DNA polymerase-3 subunit gamma/tau